MSSQIQPKCEYIRIANTTIRQELSLLHRINSINYKGDFISDPVDMHACEWMVKEIIDSIKTHTHSVNYFKMEVNEDHTRITVYRVHAGTHKRIELCHIKKII